MRQHAVYVHRLCTILCYGILLRAAPAEAVIVTGTQGNNTTAPTDPALAERWGQVGLFRPGGGVGFLGTPIAPNLFITAKHVAGKVGDTFTLSGSTFSTVAMFKDPASDLAIWQVAGTFSPGWIVPLYTTGTVAARAEMFILGVGSARGPEVTGTAYGGGTELKGWKWGDYNSASPVLSWGTNNLDAVESISGAGLQLVYSFSKGISDNEATLGYGDSGGPVFIQQGGVWSLAGINYGVNAQFNTTDSGGGFYAAIFDVGGLYEPSNGSWVYQTPTLVTSPAYAASTSTTARISWINDVMVSVPEPHTVTMLIIAALFIPLLQTTRAAGPVARALAAPPAHERSPTPAR